jgi:hypothetical protein
MTHIATHMNRNSQFPRPPQKFLVIIPSMADIPCHIHQRLLSQNLAIFPSSDLHQLTLVPDLYQPVVESSSLQETQSVVAQTQRVTESLELVDFFVDGDIETLVVHCHCCRAPPRPASTMITRIWSVRACQE